MRDVIYHNPKCSKSRAALAILQERNIDVEVFEYLNEPIDTQELLFIFEKMNYDWGIILRSKDDRFKELGLSLKGEKTAEEWIAIIQENPILLERPFVVFQDQVVMCRPTENILNIL